MPAITISPNIVGVPYFKSFWVIDLAAEVKPTASMFIPFLSKQNILWCQPSRISLHPNAFLCRLILPHTPADGVRRKLNDSHRARMMKKKIMLAAELKDIHASLSFWRRRVKFRRWCSLQAVWLTHIAGYASQCVQVDLLLFSIYIKALTCGFVYLHLLMVLFQCTSGVENADGQARCN